LARPVDFGQRPEGSAPRFRARRRIPDEGQG
jgi:hypothetical protein